jgi:AraC-like DNA-binding protein
MEKPQSLEEFYQHKLAWMPENLKKGVGHFNVFRLDDFVGPKAKCLPFSRKEYYKISFIIGHNRLYFADRQIEFEKPVLLFSSPHIPYAWEPLSDEQSGFFCIFSESFFNQFGQIREYPVFKPGNVPIFHLTEEQMPAIEAIYQKMIAEINSDFAFKYDVLRNLVFELIHSALKMQPASGIQYNDSNAAVRVASIFSELLERQFPIESMNQRMRLRAPVEFADQLSVHVNHLNRSLKEVTGKTTSQLIADRIMQEGKTLLQHTDWNIAEIGWCLGFEEPPHFINFFKKNAQVTPSAFRKMQFV